MTDLMAGEIIAIAVLVLGILYLVSKLIRGTEEPDAGVRVFVADPTPPQVLHCDGDAHDMQATPLGDGRWLHECARCHRGWWIDDCDDDYGCPMILDEDAEAEAEQLLRQGWNAVYADYGATVVHRLCLDKRTAGLPPCSDCAPRMGAAL